MAKLFETLLASGGPILAEGSVFELLRREDGMEFDPDIAHAGLVYDERFRERLAAVHLGYFEVAVRVGLPLVALTDTWRASAERVARSAFAGRSVNEDNVRFMRELRDARAPGAPPLVIAALSGPKGDAYKPDEAPGRAEARRYHGAQIEALSGVDPDVLYAATLPAVDEAHGIADAMAETGVPYVLSFVVRPDGTVLDGTPLAAAIRTIDDGARRPPAGYAVNCVHPSVFSSAMRCVTEEQPGLVDRVIWFQANTSAKSPEELDGSEALVGDEPSIYSSELAEAGRSFDVRVLGGCCGSDVRHIGELANQMTNDK